jgi:hypothetical protein
MASSRRNIATPAKAKRYHIPPREKGTYRTVKPTRRGRWIIVLEAPNLKRTLVFEPAPTER